MPEAPMIRIRTRKRDNEMAEEDKQTIKRIEHYMKNPPSGTRPFTITPVVAKYILVKYNIGNRSKKPGKIEEYAFDMLNNNWRRTMEPLKFSDKLLLRDGQNRLYACEKSGRSFEAEIGFGVPDDAFVKMDQGKSRSSGDVLQIAGYKDTNTLAAAVRWVSMFENDRVKNRDTLSPEETLKLLDEKYKTLPDLIPQAGRIYSLTRQPKGLVAALNYMFAERDAVKAQEWADAWEKAVFTGPYTPLDHAQKTLQKLHTIAMGRVHDTVRAAVLVNAWNLFITGHRGKQGDVGYTLDQPFPSIMGPNTPKIGGRKRPRPTTEGDAVAA